MTASISVPARAAGRISADRFAGFGPLFRKELREWAHSKRIWVILAVTTAFMTLTAANARDQRLGRRQRPGRGGPGRADLARPDDRTSSRRSRRSSS